MTLQLVPVMQTLARYRQLDGIRRPFTLETTGIPSDNIYFDLCFYPQLGTINLRKSTILNTSNRIACGRDRILFTARCGDETKSKVFDITNNDFPEANFTRKTLESNELLVVTVKVITAMFPEHEYCPKQHLERVLALSHKSEETIIRVLVSEEGKSSEIRAPSRKRRKLNDDEDSQHSNRSNHLNHSNHAHLSVQSLEEKDKITEHTIGVHTLVIRSASDVLNQILTLNLRGKQENELQIEAKSVKDVEDLVFWIKRHRMPMNCNAVNLMSLAHCYGLTDLYWKCVERIIRGLNVQNFVETVQLLEKWEIQSHFGVVVAFGKRNIGRIQKEDNFKELPFSFRCSLMNGGL